MINFVKNLVPTFCFLLICVAVQAQIDSTAVKQMMEKMMGSNPDYQMLIKGQVNDINGEPMPFVNVYLEKTTTGTTTNPEGRFSMRLPELMTVDLVFQFVGFEKQIVRVVPDSSVIELNITLVAEDIMLSQFVVSAKAKDPAYAIMKSAIDKRKEYLNKVDAYSAEVYMKGATRLTEIPESRPFFIPKAAMPDSTNIGLIFLSEAVAKYHFEKPNNYKEEMIASKVSGFSQAFSWNRAEDVLINFYENNVPILGISERGFISPVAATAMLYYQYRLLGSFKDHGHTIYKIEVTPRRKIDPAFEGTIYITDSLYNIHSLNLILHKNTGIEFVDSVRIDQTFVPVIPEQAVWMPISIKMHINFSIFGFKASHNAVAEFSDYDLEKQFGKKFFSNETFRIGEGANERDSLYWQRARHAILTEEELANYSKGDSLESIRSSEAYLDSIDRRFNKPTVTKLLLTGYEVYNRYDSLRYGINPLITFFQYNTVEGMVLDAAPYYGKRTKTGNYRIGSNIRYGFVSEQFYGRLNFSRLFNYKNYRALRIEGGHYVSQINSMEPISSFLNSYYALVSRLNYMKIYEKSYATVGYQQEIANGIFFRGDLEYAQRNPLFNNTDFSFYNKDNRIFTPNTPPGIQTEPGRALILEVNMRFRIKQKYETYPNRKRIIGSKFPDLFLTYRKGIAALGSKVNFDFVSGGISHDLSFGMVGKSVFDVDAGVFLNNSSMSFYDYQHFMGNQTGFINLPAASPFRAVDASRARLSNFQTLDYYSNSTNEAFVKAHYEHHFNGFIMNKLPVLRKTKFQMLAGANFLYSATNDDYTELFIGVENILKILRIDFVTAYKYGEPLKPVLRLGVTTAF